MAIYKRKDINSLSSYMLKERNIYGSSMIGTNYDTLEMIGAYIDTTRAQHHLGNKTFFLENHLGNISSSVSDRKIPRFVNGTLSKFEPEILSACDYSAFGTFLTGRTFSTSKLRYGMNGKEKDDEISGTGNDYDFGARQYDSRLGRFWSIDPKTKQFASWSPYLFAGNNPIRFMDINGEGLGDLFGSIDAAASDFGNTYNDNSISEKKEYGSTIIRVVKDNTIYYMYTTPNKAANASVMPSKPNALEGGTVVADIHTHGAYEKGYLNNVFSDTDKKDNDKKKILGYVVTPNGTLQRYDPDSKKVTTVSTNMPSDPNDWDRKNKVDGSKLPKDEPVKGVGSWLIDNIVLPLVEGASHIKGKASTTGGSSSTPSDNAPKSTSTGKSVPSF